MNQKPPRAVLLTTDPVYRKGQSIYYKGNAAEILEVKPVFTIIIKSENKVMCGDALLNEVNANDMLQ